MESLDSKITCSPPAQEEPNLKKPKMSTTTTSEDEETALNVPGDAAVGTRKQKYKRRKIAIFFAYCGVGYQGMQKNPGAKTIEGDLEEALFRAGAVPEQDRNCPKRYDWARSARTDKGVSAVGQVVSGRFYVDPPGFVERLNSELPSQFRIFGYKRVTGSFNAKKFCDRRRYVYLIPEFALDPSSHRDRESVLASLGSGSELVKCFECSERGRKVVGAVGNKRTCDPQAAADVSVGLESVVNVGGSDKQPVLSNEAVPLGEENANPKPENETLVGVDNGHAGDVGLREAVEKDVNAVVVVEQEKVDAASIGPPFCYGDEEKERFNRILSCYVGSHNFHNFTTRTKAEDPAAWRYIVSFNADTVVTVDGIDFVKCEVIGQSFMLHQIRKMIGVAVAIMRNCAPESLIKTALQKQVRLTVPTAPEVGLYLDECFFTSYNQKWKDTHEEVSMKAYEEEAEDFKMKYIYPHIASTEHKEGAVGLWLHSLNYRNYPDLRASDSGAAKPEDTADSNNVE
ncbi:tRNA pseudouridine synthase 1 [Linum grandiflorum]